MSASYDPAVHDQLAVDSSPEHHSPARAAAAARASREAEAELGVPASLQQLHVQRAPSGAPPFLHVKFTW